jgi:hypothetical protein
MFKLYLRFSKDCKGPLSELIRKFSEEDGKRKTELTKSMEMGVIETALEHIEEIPFSDAYEKNRESRL